LNSFGRKKSDSDFRSFNPPAYCQQDIAIRQLVGDDDGELAILLRHGQPQGPKVGMSAEAL